jgi:hypothetical protein
MSGRHDLQILPGTGRGTVRRSRMVEGGPSVSRWRDCHLPVPGRISA